MYALNAVVFANRAMAYLKLNKYACIHTRTYTVYSASGCTHARGWPSCLLCGGAGRFKEAEADCDACLLLDPKYTKAYARRAMARRGLKRYTEAIQGLRCFTARVERNRPLTERQRWKGMCVWDGGSDDRL